MVKGGAVLIKNRLIDTYRAKLINIYRSFFNKRVEELKLEEQRRQENYIPFRSALYPGFSLISFEGYSNIEVILDPEDLIGYESDLEDVITEDDMRSGNWTNIVINQFNLYKNCIDISRACRNIVSSEAGDYLELNMDSEDMSFVMRGTSILTFHPDAHVRFFHDDPYGTEDDPITNDTGFFIVVNYNGETTFIYVNDEPILSNLTAADFHFDLLGSSFSAELFAPIEESYFTEHA